MEATSSAGCWCYSTTIEPCIGVLQRTSMGKQGDDVVEDCPLCCDPMNVGDIRYPLVCPTMTCNFNYCADCIERFVQAAAEGYQMASDGSHQVKVIVKCPVCRSKYQITNPNDMTPTGNYHNHNNNNNTAAGMKFCTYSSDVIVQAVLTLRLATTMEALMNAQDSDLNASRLAKRQQFIEETSMEDLENAYIRLQAYHNTLAANRKNLYPGTTTGSRNDDDSNALHVVPLDWELFRPALRPKRDVPINNNQKGTTGSPNNGTHHKTPAGNHHVNASSSAPGWKDPTLFGGLEELMTSSEHEFITSMLISGQSETLSQAASILYSVMDISSSRRAQTAVRQMAGTVQSYPEPQPHSGTTTTSTASSLLSRPVRFSAKEAEHIQRVRGRFPLPIHMPRCVSIPLHDPDQVMGSRSQLLYFVKDTSNKNTATSNEQNDNMATTVLSKQQQYTLTLQSVSGIAGRVGLRKGDIVTHVEGNAVETYDEFASMLQQLLLSQSSTNISQNGGTPNVHIIVNATPEVAEALQRRYEDMQKANVRFYY